MSERVHNVGLMDQRQTILIVSGLALLGGFIFTGMAAVASRMGATTRTEVQRKTSSQPIVARTAISDSYGAKVLLVVGVGLAAFALAAWAITRM